MEWLPFDLHPEYPPDGIPRSELDRRYGEAHRENVRRMVEESGYSYRPPPEVVPNSRKALQVTELARDLGLHEQVHSRLMHAYWSEAANIGEEETLAGLAEEAGLDGAAVRAVLDEGRYLDRIEASTREANMHGINAIPAFVLDNRLLVMGAQPHALFEQAFAKLEEMGKEE